MGKAKSTIKAAKSQASMDGQPVQDSLADRHMRAHPPHEDVEPEERDSRRFQYNDDE